jgi:hypothetical protein
MCNRRPSVFDGILCDAIRLMCSGEPHGRTSLQLMVRGLLVIVRYHEDDQRQMWQIFRDKMIAIGFNRSTFETHRMFLKHLPVKDRQRILDGKIGYAAMKRQAYRMVRDEFDEDMPYTRQEADGDWTPEMLM